MLGKNLLVQGDKVVLLKLYRLLCITEGKRVLEHIVGELLKS